MIKQALSYLFALAVVAGLAVYASTGTNASSGELPAALDSVHVGSDQLHYRPGSPQLAYLAVQTVSAQEPPVIEPLPARIAYDEDHTVRVFSPVAGRAVQLLAEPGQAVHKGAVLAWLMAPDYDTAVADLRKAQADQEAKQIAYQRAQRLLDAGVMALRDMESARADALTASAEVDRAAARIKGLGSVDPAGRFALRAPLDGVVVERHLNPGQELRPDAVDPAFVITDPTHLDVVADVAEADLSVLHKGQPARLDADNPELNGVSAVISMVGVNMDPNTRRVSVRAHLVKPPASARPEAFVRLTPLAEGSDKAIAVPNAALVTSGVQTFAFVERKPGLLTKVPVTLVHRGREWSHVNHGLNAGDRVVTKGATLLDAELASGS